MPLDDPRPLDQSVPAGIAVDDDATGGDEPTRELVSPALYRQYGTDEIGKDGYPPVWHQTLKHEVRAAAGHRCLRCHHPYRNGEHGDGNWSPCDELCTHLGLVRMREAYRGDGTWAEHNLVEHGACPGDLIFDYGPSGEKLARWEIEAAWRILTVHHLDGDKANCRWWNLAALCQRCHLKIQAYVNMAQVFPHEHTEWFRPYAAGYYAFVYLNEDLSRADVESRLDELLALERA